MSDVVQITGTLQRVQTHLDTGFCVLRMTSDSANFLAVGSVMERSRLCEGQPYELSGKWKKHPKYGNQFAFDALRRQDPLSEDAIRLFLTKYCMGIGNKIAGQIFAAYGPAAINMLREHPEVVADRIPKLTREMAVQCSERLKAQQSSESVRADLMSVFRNCRISEASVEACLKEWGISAAEVIRANPYAMLDKNIPRIGFVSADTVYLALGKDPLSFTRQVRCLRYVVEAETSGSTWISKSALMGEFHRMLKIQADTVEDPVKMFTEALQECEVQEWIITNGELVSAIRSYMHERSVGQELKRLIKKRHGTSVLYHQQMESANTLNRPNQTRRFSL